MSVTIKNEEQIEKMRVAGRLAAEVLEVVAPRVVPGITTDELDAFCHEYIAGPRLNGNPARVIQRLENWFSGQDAIRVFGGILGKRR